MPIKRFQSHALVPAKTTSFIVGADLLANLHTLRELQHARYTSFLVLTDAISSGFYRSLIKESLGGLNTPVYFSQIPGGETSKNLVALSSYVTPFFNVHLTRKSAVIALGGGVVCDIAGFIASILLRGIDSIYLPTTLLAQIDAAVGGKTGVDYWHNHTMYKNMIGTFHQPTLVISDVDVLSSLPNREIISGLGEMVKYHVVWGKPTTDQLSSIRQYFMGTHESKTPTRWPEGTPRMVELPKKTSEVEELIKTIFICQRLKASIVSQDPFETLGERQKLNLGHTIGHGIESAAKGKLTHGEAVAIGLMGAAKLSVATGLLSSDKEKAIGNTLDLLGLPNRTKDISPSDVIEAMNMDKKGGTFVLIKDIGHIQCKVKVKIDIVEKVVQEICL